MKRSIFFTIILLIPSVFFAQKVKIAGTVTDLNKRPLESVVVSQGGTTSAVYTDRDGKYELDISTSDTIDIVYSIIGYEKKRYRLVGVKSDVQKDVALKLTDKILGAVTIEAERPVTVVIERVDFLATRRQSDPWNSLESLLATMGGVSSVNELSSQYAVRGGNFDENIVYINGVEVYRPLLISSAEQEGLSFINPSMVGNVKFSAGGYSAEYGDKMSSVLDISYRQPAPFEGSVSLGLLGGEAFVGSTTGKFSQVTGVRYKETRSLLKTTDTDAEYDPSFVDAQTYMTYSISPRWEASLWGNYSHNKYKFTPATRETKFGTLMTPRIFKVNFRGWENDKFVTYQGAFTLKGKVSENVNIGLTASAFSSDEHEKYDIEGRYMLFEGDATGTGTPETNTTIGIGTYHEHARNSLYSDVYTLSLFGDAKLGKHLLKWGISYQKENIKDKIKEWEMRDSAGYSLPSTGVDVNVFSNLRSDNRIKPTRISGYLQDTYNFDTEIGLFILNAGVRGSYWSFNKEFILSPRGVLAFVPEDIKKLSLRLAGGVYYQAPFYKEFQRIVNMDGNNIVELNKNIKSQKSLHLVLGADYYITNASEHPFKLSGEVYYKKLSDLVPYTVNNVKIRYAGENISDGYSMGVDVRLYGEFIPGVDSWVSFSLMKTEQDIIGAKVPLPTDQRFKLALYYQDYFPGYERLRMSLRGIWSHGLPVSAPYRGYESGYFRTPAYKRVDLGFAWQLLGEDFAIRNKSSVLKTFRNIWLGLDVFNIFDMQNVNTYYWITDVAGAQHAVPNYLTGRQLNIRLIADF
ncbi:carboxypeptidase-like regulatory domain-containing protein [Dysgonomonas sp. 511]|uniref:TonB-dependent receptor n=1 Tax=Dysgonomonas sp. 511 TaxID=2302930 RepID=UPI0013D4C630|nr:carboxypeptidase-like regulatory domain-containing protein [Dysgonomonas sp. 511]NDV79474.1 TonB-dependent receptor [Dysgonomonas sp. 511]